MKRDFFARIKTTYQSLSPSEKKVGDYILQHAHDVMSMTLAELADKCQVSDATALRFSRHLGYKGWLQLKVALIQSLPQHEKTVPDSLIEKGNYKQIFSKIIENSKKALEDTFLIFDNEEMTQVIEVIRNARQIFIGGSGTSGPVANDLYNRLFRLGFFCRVETDGLLQLMHTSLLTEKDVLIVISQSGEAESIIRIADIARHNCTPVITITGSRLSALARISDHILLSVCHESNPEAMTARIAQHAIVHAVYQALESQMHETSQKNEDSIWNAFFPVEIG